MKAMKTELTDALTAEELTVDAFNAFLARYEEIPSYEIDWKVADLSPEDGHALAQDIREQLQQMTGVIGVNRFIPARFVGNP